MLSDTAMERQFGLIGYPLSHSFSEKYFSDKFEKERISDCRYTLFPLKAIDGLRRLVAAQTGLSGLNVTIPHKISVIPFLDEMDAAAQQIGAVNCIALRRRGEQLWLKGYNTDAYGFSASLRPFLEGLLEGASGKEERLSPDGANTVARGETIGLAPEAGQGQMVVRGEAQEDVPGKEIGLAPEEMNGLAPGKSACRALIFGDGGAAQAVKYVLREMHIPFKSVLRRPEAGALLYEELSADHIAGHRLLINTTPLGMWPDVKSFPPIPYHAITPAHLAYDLVYNPEETAFLRQARLQGARTLNGLAMLHLQAERAWEIWNTSE